MTLLSIHFKQVFVTPQGHTTLISAIRNFTAYIFLCDEVAIIIQVRLQLRSVYNVRCGLILVLPFLFFRLL